MQDLIIPGNVLEELQMTPSEMLLEIAVFLYQSEKLTMGQAKKLAGLTQLAFQQELSKRNVYIHYGVQEFETDLKNLSTLE